MKHFLNPFFLNPLKCQVLSDTSLAFNMYCFVCEGVKSYLFFSHLRTNMVFWSHYYSSIPRSGQVYAFYSFCIGCQKGTTIDFYINVAIFFLLASFNLNLNAFCGVLIPSYALFCVVLKTFSCGSKKQNHKCSLSIFV